MIQWEFLLRKAKGQELPSPILPLSKKLPFKNFLEATESTENWN